MKPLKHWQDPVNALIGVFLILSPWLLGYAGEMSALANALLAGALLVAVALGAMFMPRAWEEWSEAVIGLWLLASPWIVGFAAQAHARNAALIAGIVVLVLALWTLAADKDYSAWMHKHGT